MGQNILAAAYQSAAARCADWRQQTQAHAYRQQQKSLAARPDHPLALSQWLRKQSPGTELMYVKTRWFTRQHYVSCRPPRFYRDAAHRRYLKLLKSMGIQAPEGMPRDALIGELYALGAKQIRGAENDTPQAKPAVETAVVADATAQDLSPSMVCHESGRRRALDAQHSAADQAGRGWGAQP